ncbi:MAG: SH3 domain-containing protein [Deltaproteobacteria bacterium]|nr:SH3 domain-containing protein [Deltaproteobacteria bacterium]
MQRVLVIAAVMVSLLTAPAWGKTMMSIGKDKVNIRSGPSLKSEVLFQVHLGYPIQVLERKGEWVRFKDWVGNTGWVYRPLLSDIPTAVVLKERVNVRRGPGLKHKVVGQVDKGEVYRIFDRRGKWVKIGYYIEKEEIGWVRNDMVWGD